MKSNNTQLTTTTLLSTTATIVTTVAVFRYLQRRARVRARESVERVQASLKQNQPIIDIQNEETRRRVVDSAIRRASKWMTLSREDAIKPLPGQVGGASVHKKPLMTLEPDYVLKPLLADHRGVREIAFYQAMAVVGTKGDMYKVYRNFIKGPGSTSSTSTRYRLSNWLDTLAVFGAVLCHDPVVMALEAELDAASKKVRNTLKKEAELLSRLSNLTPPYYGVWGQEEYDPSVPYGIDEDSAHLLLQNITINYVQPCVMDLKLGTQTFEPDAPMAKRDRELSKYSAQAEIGFRIVGMRVYDPTHPDADHEGFRFWKKEFGRSLDTVEKVKDAMRTFFLIPLIPTVPKEDSEDPPDNEETSDSNGNGSAVQNMKDQVAPSTSEESSPDKDAVSLKQDGGNTEVSASPSVGDETEPPTAPATPPPNLKEPRLRLKAISNLLLQLRSIRRWFDENDCFHFYASSLLMVYEGDRDASDVTALKMIDFGRVRRQSGGDDGYKKGLKMLKHVLTDLLEEEEERLGYGDQSLMPP